MCEIQLVHKFDNELLTYQDKGVFADLLSLGSQSNGDAWGYYDVTNETLKKDHTKYGFECVKELMNEGVKTSTIFGHNRFKTKGDKTKNENNHPFETDKFIVVHNGMISNDEELKANNGLTYTVETDSYIVSALLEHIHSEGINVVESIRKVAETLSGTYSIMVYYKPEKRLFYFKNNSTKFTFGLIKLKNGQEILLGSTDKDNFKYVYKKRHRGEFKISEYKISTFEPTDSVVYEITNEEILTMDTFKYCEYGNSKCMVWDDTLKEFVADAKIKKKNEDKWTSYSSFGGYDGYGNKIRQPHNEDVYHEIVNAEEQKDAKEDKFKENSKERILEIATVLKWWEGFISDFMQEFCGVKTLNEVCNVKKGTVRFVLDRELSKDEQYYTERELSQYGIVTFKTRTKSKVGEMIIEFDDDMLYYDAFGGQETLVEYNHEANYDKEQISEESILAS